MPGVRLQAMSASVATHWSGCVGHQLHTSLQTLGVTGKPGQFKWLVTGAPHLKVIRRFVQMALRYDHTS